MKNLDKFKVISYVMQYNSDKFKLSQLSWNWSFPFWLWHYLQTSLILLFSSLVSVVLWNYYLTLMKSFDKTLWNYLQTSLILLNNVDFLRSGSIIVPFETLYWQNYQISGCKFAMQFVKHDRFSSLVQCFCRLQSKQISHFILIYSQWNW